MKLQLKWGPVGIDIIDVEHSNELLGKIVEMWVALQSLLTGWNVLKAKVKGLTN